MDFKKELALRAPGFGRGFFITLEGLDGAGKTTQAAHLAEALRGLGLDPLETREPTGGPWGRKIRELAARGRQGTSPEEELDYFVRDRAEDVARFAPALLAGRPVVADRYVLSNIAYQSALGLDEKRIVRANQAFPWPDLIVILEVPVATGLARITRGRQGGTDAAFEESGYLARVKAAFDRQSRPEIVRLDGLADPARITALILDELRRRSLLPDGPFRIVDSHCHLTAEDFSRDFDATLDRARAAGVVAVLDVGLGPEGARRTLTAAARYPLLRPVLGWHPHEADEFTPQGLRELVDLARRPEVVGFGEIGLDFALNFSTRENQLRAFESLLEAATDLDLPVVIHSRDAFRETLDLLVKYAPGLKKGGVIHCFTRGWDEAGAWLDLGFDLSLPGVLTFPRHPGLAEAVSRAPAGRLLVETDAPYLTPAPFRGRRNEPAHLVWTLKALAGLRGLTLTEAANLTAANAVRRFGLELPGEADRA